MQLRWREYGREDVRDVALFATWCGCGDDDLEETEQPFCVHLHVLILDLFPQITRCEQVGQGAHHFRTVQAYSSTISRLPSYELSEQLNTARWSLRDDGYAYSNVTRHLVGAGLCAARIHACDPRLTKTLNASFRR